MRTPPGAASLSVPSHGVRTEPDPALSIVVAMFNEAENVDAVTREIAAVFADHAAFEIVVVDDGSEDGTGKRLTAMRATIPCLRVVRHDLRAGQSFALISGVRAARAPLILTMDGDGQNDPASGRAMVDHAAGRAMPFIAGVRHGRADTPSKRVASVLANGFRRAVLRDGCPDTGCGLKLFPRETFLLLPPFDGLHRYLPALLTTLGLRMELFPVAARPRLSGRSKYTNVGRALVGIVDVLGVLWLRRRLRDTGRVTIDQDRRSTPSTFSD